MYVLPPTFTTYSPLFLFLKQQAMLPIIFADTPFGFNEIRLGSITVYTAKLRFRGIKYEPGLPYIHVFYHGEYCFISFETVDKLLADHMYQLLGRLAKQIGQAKLDKKWGWIK